MRTSKIVILCFVTIFIVQSTEICFAQNKFLKGYFVDNNEKKTECLVKVIDKKGFSKNIQYKLSENSSLQTAYIDNIKEYGFDNYSKYVRFTVKTEFLFGKDIKSSKKDIEWCQDIVFLKELVKGKASLWKSELPTKDLFFYSMDNGQPQLLIHKIYFIDNITSENNTFREQIYNNLRNENTKYEIPQLLNYNESSFVKYFSVYNKNTDFVVNSDIPKPKREILNFKISGSISYNKFSITNPSYYPPVLYFDDKINWMAGAEVEYFLPFYWNKWSLLLAPSYESTYYNRIVNNDIKKIDIKDITFPIGLRYTQQISNSARFYINVLYNPTINLHFSNSFYFMEYTSPIYTNELSNLIVGVGFGIKNLGLEIKYHTSRTLFSSTICDNPKVSLTFSYKLLTLKSK